MNPFVVLGIVISGWFILAFIYDCIMNVVEDNRFWREFDKRMEQRQREWNEQLKKALWEAMQSDQFKELVKKLDEYYKKRKEQQEKW